MRLTTLNISSNLIRYTASNGGGTVKHGAVAPEGLINNGLILQPDAIAGQIKALFSSNALPREKVICSINGLPFSYRLFTLPQMEPAAFNEAILRETRKEMPVSLDEMYLTWQAYRNGGDEWQVLVAGITRQPVDNLIKTLRTAGVSPYYLDLQHLSLARLTDEADAIIVEMEKDYSNIVMLVEGIPQALHIVPGLGPEAALADEVLHIADQLVKTINFYNGSHPGKPVKPAAKILLTGALANDDQVPEIFRQSVKYPVALLSPVGKVNNGLPVHDFAVNAGSMLMNVAAEKEAGQNAAPCRSINLARIAQEMRGGSITGKMARRMIVPAVLIAGMAGVLFAYQAQGGLQGDYDQAQAALTQARTALSQAKTAQDTVKTSQSQISQAEAQLQSVKDSYLQVIGSNDYVADIQSITQSTPDGLICTSLDINTGGITIHGTTRDAALVVRFARNLETTGGFTKANIEAINAAGSKDATWLAFVIDVSR